METYTRADAQSFLERLAGPAAQLRDDQWQALDTIVNERSPVLLVQATGWGKSAVYFAATDALRSRGFGTTILVSPLLALMRNQVEAAERAGVHAVTVNSTNADDHDQLLDDVAGGRVDVLLVSPERLANPRFAEETLPALARQTGLLVVDEAHCLSDWGHDFRPDYLRLRRLVEDLDDAVPVLACTATANARVSADVAQHLTGSTATPARVLRGPMRRPSLRLASRPRLDPVDQIAWLTQVLPQLPGSGIVYSLTVAQATDVAEHLTRHTGLPVAAYTGQTADDDRVALEGALARNEVKALVATSALGMGYDKPDLGFVVHLGLPSSPVAYYQQVGRAGRAVDDAVVIAAPTTTDQRIWDYFESVSFPDPEVVDELLGALDTDQPRTVPSLEADVDLRRTRLEMVLKVLAVDGAVERTRAGWVRTGKPWEYDDERYSALRSARRVEREQMLAYPDHPGCRMAYLTGLLDDPDITDCGRCDRCDPAGPLTPLVAATGAVSETRAALTRPGVPIVPKRMWPGAGRIPADEQALAGRAVGRLSDPVLGQRLAEVVSGPDAELPDDLVPAVVETLKSFGWDERPVAIVCVGSRQHPRLITSLAERIGEIGRLPVLGSFERTDSATVDKAGNSAHHHRAAQAALRLPPELAAAAAGATGPLLLVDDVVDSGWTLAVAAAQLRGAGAPGVLPLALASRA